MKKKITKKGYRVLAVVWTLAAASMALAFGRRLALTALSILAANNFWQSYRRAPDEAAGDPFASPPKFADNPVLFDDDPPRAGHLNKDSEENTHE